MAVKRSANRSYLHRCMGSWTEEVWINFMFQNDGEKLDADIAAVRIWYAYIHTVPNHVIMVGTWIRACESQLSEPSD